MKGAPHCLLNARGHALVRSMIEHEPSPEIIHPLPSSPPTPLEPKHRPFHSPEPTPSTLLSSPISAPCPLSIPISTHLDLEGERALGDDRRRLRGDDRPLQGHCGQVGVHRKAPGHGPARGLALGTAHGNKLRSMRLCEAHGRFATLAARASGGRGWRFRYHPG